MPDFAPLIVDQTDWGHILVTGEDRVRFMQGMCTANISAMASGDHAWASILNVKGRLMSVIDVVCREDDLLLHCEPSLTEKTIGLLSRYAVMDDVVFESIAMAAHRVWGAPASVWEAPVVPGAPPAPAASAEAIEARRIAAGFPRYGVDAGEDNFPFETLLGSRIDYTKGCYIGQEPVFRVHSKGQASHTLRGLRVESDAALERGAVVAHPARANAGEVTSAAMSPELGSIALALLHRTAWEPGARVTVGERGVAATIVELPFG
jgi:folate-binding protein YgfZ